MNKLPLSPEVLQRALGEVVKRERTALGFSQEEFAAQIGLHRTYVGSIERGERNLTFRTLALIASSLDSTVSGLMLKVENAYQRNGK